MHKKMMIVMALVLGLSMVGWADIDQSQILDIGSANSLLLSGSGLVIGSSTNLVSANTVQEATGANGRVFVMEYEDATLIQNITGSGSGGSYGVDQLGLGTASQAQSQDGLDQGDQTQSLSTSLDTTSAAVGGDALISTLQGFIGNQVQLSLTPYSASVNVSSANVIDSAYIRNNAAQTIANGVQ